MSAKKTACHVKYLYITAISNNLRNNMYTLYQ